MSGRYIIPPPPVKDIEEGDVLEINNDLFVAVEDSTFVGQTAPFDKKNEKHAVKLRGANSGQSMCHLAEIPIEKTEKKNCSFGVGLIEDTKNGLQSPISNAVSERI